MSNHRGFTLLEVMLALLVLAIALGALVRSAQLGADTVSKLEQNNSAYHVADQALMGLYQVSGLSPGRHQGDQQFKDQRWYWQADVQSTENPRIAKINIQVSTDSKMTYVAAQLTGFKSL